MSLSSFVSSLASSAAAECKSLRSLLNGNVANLSALTTTEKSNLVLALNEVRALAASASAPSFAQSRWAACDFYQNATANVDPFALSAIGSGLATTLPTFADALHQGMVLLRSSTTANSGVRVATNQPLISAQGLITRTVFRTMASLTGLTKYVGFHNATTVSQPVNGSYVKIVAGVLTAETATNSVRTTSATTLTLAVNTFYTVDIEYLTASSVRFVVFNDAGTKLYDQTISTNVPALIARSFSCGVVATSSGTTATDIIALDYMGLGTERPSFIVTPA